MAWLRYRRRGSRLRRDGDPIGLVELRRRRGSAVAGEPGGARARDRADRAAGRDGAERMVEAVGDEVPAARDRGDADRRLSCATDAGPPSPEYAGGAGTCGGRDRAARRHVTHSMVADIGDQVHAVAERRDPCPDR